MTNSNGSRTASSSVVISGNKFTSIDVADTAPSDKIGTRGVIQIASTGDYSSTKFDLSDNTSSTCGPIIRQLNSTVKFSGDNVADLRALAGDGTLATIDSVALPVASAGDATYGSVQEAINAAEADSTVKLLANVTEDVTVASGKTVTLDLNGCTLTNVSSHTVTNNGTLTITDSSTNKTGTIDNVTHAKEALHNTGKLTLNGGTFERSAEAGTLNANGGNSYYTVENAGSGADMTVNDGVTIINKGTYSSNVKNNAGAVLTINGGVFEGGKDTVKNDNDSEDSKVPTLTINGGVFKNNAHNAVRNWSVATITGGTFDEGADGQEVLFNSSYGDNRNSLKVTGGTFKSSSTTYGMIVNGYENYVGTAAISGGMFSAEVPSKCLAEGYAAVLGSDGTYVVAKNGEQSKSEDGKNSGSTQTSGVDVSNSTQLAEDAVAAAAAVKDIERPTPEEGETTATATIGGFTVEVAEDQANNLKAVKEAAETENASVDVNLVVKADTNVEADKAINDKANGADVIPFKLSVDMVTTVKSNNEVKATASLPVVETASAIKVTISVDPNSILSKRVSVARNHNGEVAILSADVNYETGAVTFSTDKFSDYAVLASAEGQSYELSKYTDGTARKTITNSDFCYSDDYAFAGWYKDSQLTEAYDSSATEGTAFPKFVEISDLIKFKGGSLRMDLTGSDDYTKTSLRFGYEMKVPDGATLDADEWGWNYVNPTTNASSFASVQKYWLTGDNGAIANLVFSPIYKSGQNDEGTKTGSFDTAYQVTAQIGYTTADGTSVTAKDQTQTRSVKQVATAIKANSFASDVEKTYANGILGTE